MNVNASTQAGGIANTATASFTSDGTAATVKLGFVPRFVKVVNSTDAIIWEKITGMAAANSVKTVGGTVAVTVDTGSAILINTDGTITLSSTLAGTGKSIAVFATA